MKTFKDLKVGDKIIEETRGTNHYKFHTIYDINVFEDGIEFYVGDDEIIEVFDDDWDSYKSSHEDCIYYTESNSILKTIDRQINSLISIQTKLKKYETV